MDFLKRAKNEMLKAYFSIGEVAEGLRKDKSLKKPFAAGITLAVAANCTCLAFAGNDIATLGSEATKILSDIYTQISGVVTLIAAILLAVAWITRMTGNPQKAAQATDWIKRILICYAGFFIMGLIFSVIKTTSENNHWNEIEGLDKTAGTATTG